MKEVQLFAPNGLPIVGALANDGAIKTFRYSYDKATETSWYEMNEGAPLTKASVVLQDSSGQQWSATDVEWHTLFERR